MSTTLLGFPAALAFALKWEGGFVHHPADPGGATNRGVTQRTYTDRRRRRGLPEADVRDILDAEVESIYQEDYWVPARCRDLPSHVNVAVFDAAVNMGVRTSVRLLEAASGCPVDGVVGPRTLEALNGAPRAVLLTAHCTRREQRYHRLVERNPQLEVFLRGWLRRLHDLCVLLGVPVGPLSFVQDDTWDPEVDGRLPRVQELGLPDGWIDDDNIP